ncbi:haloacid dehalogenase superfamily, subfamily IA, variant 3 with third motif having DD or ED [Rathayibacter oskolensis]|uniref:Haloacid dehalogenase superfamily, subfamily IA, variant 3 with third motif having DD or ED n=1 Tax=Rathayibacter oskolensis TaxID=1891671 RepID=A0A1X7MU44_9MICO|nr:HAD family phosphatase [Rathayibacter oskolensis]SMH27848.1 haloacid dehalogenase superfamily, subfamily IA, variant 3 with third motif having DD or ED [Rathayibacter oskolensis]
MPPHDPTDPAAVLWDMDGTLVVSEPAWIRAQAALAERFGCVWTQADAVTLIGSTMQQTVEALQAAGVALEDDALASSLENDVLAEMHRELSWRPGARELMREVAGAGIPQAIVTTSSRPVAQVVVDALAAEVPLATVVTGDDVVQGKPHPEPYLLAATRLGVDVAHCIAVEDSPTGLAAAIASGAVPVGVPHDAVLEEGGDRTIWPSLSGRTLADLRGLVARRLRNQS